MRSGVASVLATGVLALGVVPTTLALADDAGTEQLRRDGAGPPPWAPAHGHDKTKGKHAEKAREQAEKRQQQAEWPENAEGPPPWAKAYGKRGAHGKGRG